MRYGTTFIVLGAALVLVGCADDEKVDGHGEMAEGIYGALGDPVPYATAEQLATFERGREVSLRRFALADGLGPAFNVSFCASCHERPVTGGSAGLYRSFFLGAVVDDEGVYRPLESAGPAGGVVRLYRYEDEESQHPELSEDANVIAQRNPIPFFGVGLIAELPESEILRRADPDDRDGDGISGRPNYDRGFVGRFGRKAQTVSIEGFIRGPLFNHLGVTTDPLTDAQRASLPVDSSGTEPLTDGQKADRFRTVGLHQAAAAAEPLFDDDEAPDPELSTNDLFDLVSFSMLLAAPAPEPLTERAIQGRDVFDDLRCGACHTPRLSGPRGPLPIYSDLLLHDMGPDLADGLRQGEATGAEFRTQPLWGIAAVGPYLHDGRATTLEEAIAAHGGEGEAARDAWLAASDDDQQALVEFLLSLGGREQYSPGLIPPGTPIPSVGEYGGPVSELGEDAASRFRAGRALFDRDFGFDEGVGGPRFNGDSCRACHFEPTVGGAGPRGVNVVRHGFVNGSGAFVPPAVGTILHRVTALRGEPIRPQGEVNVFELRQTPHVFGLGLIDGIPDEVITANADPDDTISPDGISGRPSRTDGGRLGRLGWKAQVPSTAEFVRDALTAELGLTVEMETGLTFGALHDNDDVPDPEVAAAEAAAITEYLHLLGPPPRGTASDAAAAAAGEELFAEIGCASCHIPELDGADGPVPLYSDLLLHEVLPEGAYGIEDAGAGMREFRTAPLWGVSQTAPYLHDGSADTLDEAIRAHAGEAQGAVDDYVARSDADRSALVVFLETL